MMNIKLATDNRKAAAARLAEITGTESHYTKVPRCAYEVGPYAIDKDGNITVAEGADLQPLQTLADEGMVEPFEAPATEPAAEDETVSLTVEVPMPAGCPSGWSTGSFFMSGFIKIGSLQAWDGRGIDKFPRKGEREYASNEDHIACRDKSACRSPAYR